MAGGKGAWVEEDEAALGRGSLHAETAGPTHLNPGAGMGMDLAGSTQPVCWSRAPNLTELVPTVFFPPVLSCIIYNYKTHPLYRERNFVKD